MGFAQSDATKDSLLQILKSAQHDTIRLQVLSHLIETEYNDEIWPKYNKEMKSIAEKLLINQQKPIVIRVAKKYLAEAYNNIGFIYDNQGDISNALENYGKGLRIREEIGDKIGIATSLNNIGYIFTNQDDNPKALEYFLRSIEIQKEIGYKGGMALSLNNIGFIYDEQGDSSKAFECHYKSLKTREEIEDKSGVAMSLGNLGFHYKKHGNLTKGLEFYNKSYKVYEEIEDKFGMARLLYSIGSIYSAQLKLADAQKYFEKSYQLSKELGYPITIENAASGLKEIYEKQGNYKLAYQYYQEEIKMRDSIQNEANYKASVQQKSKYEYEKKAATDSIANAKEKEIKDAEIAQQQAEIKAKRNQQYGLIGGLALVLVFAGFVYNRLKVTQQQKRIIELQKLEVEQQKQIVEKQKELVEEKQDEILASIRYAKRIQDALLTSQTYIERNIKRLKNS
jgi:tetratricopeptide (TPR) repeat protein